MRCTNFYLIFLFITLVFQLSSQEVYEQTLKETVTFSSSERLISVHNINGSINIEGYSGNQAIIEAEQFIKMKRGGDIDAAKAKINLKVVEDNGVVVVYVEEPQSTFDLIERNYNFDHNDYRRRNYHYYFDITIKVPYNTNVEASAMNDGDLLIRNIEASELLVNNLNGKITLENVAGQINANALNEDIDVLYSANPTEESWFNALNGDVNVTVPKDLDADITFKSLNGAFYSNLDVSAKHGTLIKNVSNNGKRTKYKLSSKNNFVIGSGGPALHFDLLNGNVNLMK